MVKAIETLYDGYRFRSRLEARWAVFFKTLGIKYEYEKEGYDLDGTYYLPDFWLPEQDCFIEIKGQEPTCNEFSKAAFLSWNTGKRVFIFFGDIQIPTSLGNGTPSDAIFSTVTPAFGCVDTGFCLKEDKPDEFRVANQSAMMELIEGLGLSKKVRCLEELAKDILSNEGCKDRIADIRFWKAPMFWTACLYCKKLDITYRGYITRMPCRCVELKGWKEEDGDYYGFNLPHLVTAYIAARSARFEHGESPH